jgi:hypothetical protein
VQYSVFLCSGEWLVIQQHTHTHTHASTRSRTHTRARTHARKRTRTHARTYTHAHTHTLTHTHTRAHDTLLRYNCEIVKRMHYTSTNLTLYVHSLTCLHYNMVNKRHTAIHIRYIFPFIILSRSYYRCYHTELTAFFAHVLKHVEVVLTFPSWSAPSPLLWLGSLDSMTLQVSHTLISHA